MTQTEVGYRAGPTRTDQSAEAAKIRGLVRFTLPFFAKVVVVSEGDESLVDLEDRITWHFPCTEAAVFAGPHPLSSTDAITELERLRSLYGAQYLLIPSKSAWWLELFDDFRRHVASNYRVVVNEPDTCVIFALHEPRDVEFRKKGAPDLLPLPTAEMIALTMGFFDSRTFFGLSEQGAAQTRGILARHGRDPAQCRSMLDFGCGCGRIMRQWKNLNGPRLFGADYNPYLVEWCRKTMPFASFEQALMPEGLTYDDDSIEIVYSLSVFTHLDPEAQAFWIGELARILEPGGLLYLTLQGKSSIGYLTQEEQDRFLAGEMVMRAEDHSGASSCVVYHPEQYVREHLGKDFEVVAYLDGGAEDMMNQDVVLLQKPS